MLVSLTRVLAILGLVATGLCQMPCVAFAQASYSGVIQPFSSGFKNPAGVAIDSSGNIFIADTGNNVIKEVMASDGSTRIFQPGVPVAPRCIALDAGNNLYIGSASPFITELRAPAYAAFSTYGTLFANTQGIAVDAVGDVYAAVAGNNSINELVAIGGVIGNNSTQRTWKNTAWFNSAVGIALDPAGDLFIADPFDHAVKELGAIGGKIPDAPPVTTIGSGFNTPFALAFDAASNLYVAEIANNGSPAVLKQALAGTYATVNTLAATFVAGTALSAPSGLAVDNSTGKVYIADAGAAALGVFAAGSAPIGFGTLALNAPSLTYSIPFFYHSTGNPNPAGPIVVLNGTAPSPDFFDIGSGSCKSMQSSYQGDHCTVDIAFKPSQYGTRSATLQIEDITGAVIAPTKVQLTGSATLLESFISNGFDHPEGLAFDGAGNLYVADTLDRRILSASGSGISVSAAVAFGGFAFDSSGTLFYGDMLHNSINKVNIIGGVTTSTPVIATGLSGPRAVAMDRNNNLYIADANNGTLKQSLAPGYNTVTSLAPFQLVAYPVSIAVSKKTGSVFVSTGGGVELLTPQGTGFNFQRLIAFFNGSAGLALDSADNLFVIETGTRSIRMIAAPYADQGVTIPLPASLSFNNPQGLAVDANDTLYVADTNNNRIAKITLTAGSPLQ